MNKSNKKPTENLDYEKDPRFLEFIKNRLDMSKDPKYRKTMVDGHLASQRIRQEFGLI